MPDESNNLKQFSLPVTLKGLLCADEQYNYFPSKSVWIRHTHMSLQVQYATVYRTHSVGVLISGNSPLSLVISPAFPFVLKCLFKVL